VKIESARMTPEEGGYETWREEPVARTLNGMGQAGTNGALAVEPIAFHSTGGSRGLDAGKDSPPLKVGSGLGIPSPPAITSMGGVRRLTPTECERLQSFPDGWTIIEK
jgi:site-specific DNA-cytosine methylase